MPRQHRLALIQQLEQARGSKVICYLTSLRQNVPGQIADDQVRVFFDHLLQLPRPPIEKLDIFLCSNGGSGTVPWRLVSLFREFARSFAVLIPYRAYSAATLLALGADEIVMHPFAELGPIDPTVANDFNPIEQHTGRRLGISVEDVTAYVNFIKSTVGITHEDELVKTIEILANKVHPLALGNIERFVAQSRMIAKKILRTHMTNVEDHTIDEIVENMASKLYFHGHPINRREAKADLRLRISANPEPELEALLWQLYTDFEAEFENRTSFSPEVELASMSDSVVEKEYTLTHAMIESVALSSRYVSQRRYRMARFVAPPNPLQQAAIQEEVVAQAWSHSAAAEGGTPMPPSPTGPAGTPTPGVR